MEAERGSALRENYTTRVSGDERRLRARHQDAAVAGDKKPLQIDRSNPGPDSSLATTPGSSSEVVSPIDGAQLSHPRGSDTLGPAGRTEREVAEEGGLVMPTLGVAGG